MRDHLDDLNLFLGVCGGWEVSAYDIFQFLSGLEGHVGVGRPGSSGHRRGSVGEPILKKSNSFK